MKERKDSIEKVESGWRRKKGTGWTSRDTKRMTENQKDMKVPKIMILKFGERQSKRKGQRENAE